MRESDSSASTLWSQIGTSLAFWAFIVRVIDRKRRSESDWIHRMLKSSMSWHYLSGGITGAITRRKPTNACDRFSSPSPTSPTRLAEMRCHTPVCVTLGQPTICKCSSIVRSVAIDCSKRSVTRLEVYEKSDGKSMQHCTGSHFAYQCQTSKGEAGDMDPWGQHVENGSRRHDQRYLL